MKNFLTIFLVIVLFSNCNKFEYHPYDVNISGQTNVNAENIKQILQTCDGKDTLRVVFTGDTQGWFDDTKDLIASVNNLEKVDFVVHGGDVSDYGMTKEFMLQRDILNTFKVPYVVLLGNHDCLGTGKDVYNKIFGQENFNFIVSGVNFVCINTNALEFDYSNPIPDFDFLENQIADSAKYQRTIINMHAKPYNEQFNNNVAKVFEYYVTRFKGLLFCTCAHSHNTAQEDIYGDGVMYYTCACANNRQYNLITITPNGYEFQVIDF